MAYPDRRTSSLQSKPTPADSRLKEPSIPEQTGLCRFTNHHKGGCGNGRKIQNDTRTSTHLASEDCNTLPAYCSAGKVASEASSTPAVRHHHLHLDVSIGYFDSQMMDLLGYHPISRPWQELGHSESGSAMSADAGSPLEKWERETIRDQAWNGVAGVYGVSPARSPDIVLAYEWSGPVKEGGSDKTQLKSLL
jgi:hypothetical protein